MEHQTRELLSPPPPQYNQKRSHPTSGLAETSNSGNGSWLLRRTSFTIESTPAAADNNSDKLSDQLSITSSARSEEKRRLRNVISRFGRLGDELPDDGRRSRSSEGTAQPYDGERFGTTVSIEVGHNARPRTQRRHEMKGLEEAASMKQWTGSGKPAGPWGKLAKVGLENLLRSELSCLPHPRAKKYLGSRTMGRNWRHTCLLRLSTPRSILPGPILSPRKHKIGYSNFQAPGRLPSLNESNHQQPLSPQQPQQKPPKQNVFPTTSNTQPKNPSSTLP